ncbi:MAG: DUF433 domain-containing protein [Blastocatellia bacterium]
MAARKRKEYGGYIVSDPKICGGDLTFKGTRILVKDVLYFVAKGYDWKQISAEYDNRLSYEAIAEAVELARHFLIQKTEKQRRAA